MSQSDPTEGEPAEDGRALLAEAIEMAKQLGGALLVLPVLVGVIVPGAVLFRGREALEDPWFLAVCGGMALLSVPFWLARTRLRLAAQGRAAALGPGLGLLGAGLALLLTTMIVAGFVGTMRGAISGKLVPPAGLVWWWVLAHYGRRFLHIRRHQLDVLDAIGRPVPDPAPTAGMDSARPT